MWGLPYSFKDLGYLHPDSWPLPETRAIAWEDADGLPGEDPGEAVQTTIIRYREETR